MFNYQYQNKNNRLCPVHTEAWPLRCGETVTDSFHTVAAVRQRLAYMLNAFPGTLWRDSGHEGRMESVCFLSDFDRRYGENEYYAAVYLLTSGIDLYRRTVGCYTPTGIRFDRARRRGISIRDYDLLGAAKTIYYGTPDLTLDDLSSYTRLSDTGDILGLTTYADVDVELDRYMDKQTITVPKNTILIDDSLVKPVARPDVNRGRRRFTISHECSHQILFRREPVERQQVLLRQYSGRSYSLRELVTKEDWSEWQANALGAALLMPPVSIRLLMAKHGNRRLIC